MERVKKNFPQPMASILRQIVTLVCLLTEMILAYFSQVELVVFLGVLKTLYVYFVSSIVMLTNYSVVIDTTLFHVTLRVRGF